MEGFRMKLMFASDIHGSLFMLKKWQRPIKMKRLKNLFF